MGLFLLAVIVIFLSLYLYKNRHFFNFDVGKDHGTNPQMPLIKNGFSLALMTTRKSFKSQINYKLTFVNNNQL